MFGSVYDWVLGQMEEYGLRAWRHELIHDLAGQILEVGAGTGLNLEHYTEAVDRLVLVEPDGQMRGRLERRSASCQARDIEIVPHGLEALEEPPQTFDAVVCTLVFCTLPDPQGALARVRELLAPGGKMVFIEHVAAPEGSRRLLLQRLAEPVWRPLAGNCHLTRRTEETIRQAGFEIDWCRRQSMRKALPIIRPSIRGVARPG